MFITVERTEINWFIPVNDFREAAVVDSFIAHEHVGELHNCYISMLRSWDNLSLGGRSSMVTSSRLRLIFRHFVYSRMGDMSSKAQMPTPETALSGRADSMNVAGKNQAASVEC